MKQNRKRRCGLGGFRYDLDVCVFVKITVVTFLSRDKAIDSTAIGGLHSRLGVGGWAWDDTMEEFTKFRIRTDGLDTHTSREQEKCETDCVKYFADAELFPPVAFCVAPRVTLCRLFLTLDLAFLFGAVQGEKELLFNPEGEVSWPCIVQYRDASSRSACWPQVKLVREEHIAYLLQGLEHLPHFFTGLDARFVAPAPSHEFTT